MKVKDKTIGGVTMAQNLTYTRCGDYLIPDIRLSYTSDKPLGNTAGCAELIWSKTTLCYSMI